MLQIGYPATTMKTTKIREISVLSINVNTINTTVDLQVCTTIQEATAQDAHLQDLKAYIIDGWPHKKDDENKTYRNIGPSAMSWP